jgi:hypothetical protein
MNASIEERLPGFFDSAKAGLPDAPRDVYRRLQFLSREWSATVATGVTRGRLGVSIGLDTFQRNAQAHRDRPFSRTANLVPRYNDALIGFDYGAISRPQAASGG